ncbi:MAG TPA: PfkB family carbohydrate kinase, partial [Pseudonocardia sp.]|nr:PfkB family carbohydrate kinase [Pseudonocardia sp.]
PARIRTRAGGAGANTAAWLAHLGAEVTLVGRVGADPAGRAATRDLAAAGVRTALAVDPTAPTCTVVVLLGDGERTMLSDRGAAARLAVTDLPARWAEGGGADRVDHLHLSGYVLLDPSSRAAGLAALDLAAAAGMTRSVDPQAAPALTPGFRAWVRGVDLLLPNADELAALGPEPLVPGVGAVAATRGAAGATWQDGHDTWSVPAAPAEVVDPTGAGDAFDAGLLVAWLGGAGPVESLRAGCAAAATAVGTPGARPAPSIPAP